MIKSVPFMRVEGRLVPQFKIAQPMLFDTSKWSDTRNFILCKIEEANLPVEMHHNKNIKLKIDQLQARYPDTTEEYVDEEGNTHTVDVYDYFDPNGRSSEAEAPVIDFNDVIRGDR